MQDTFDIAKDVLESGLTVDNMDLAIPVSNRGSVGSNQVQLAMDYGALRSTQLSFDSIFIVHSPER